MVAEKKTAASGHGRVQEETITREISKVSDELRTALADFEASKTDTRAARERYEVSEKLKLAKKRLAKSNVTADDVCLKGLAHFYLAVTECTLDEGRWWGVKDALAGWHDTDKAVPSLYDSIVASYEAINVPVDLADMEDICNVAGEQVIALILEEREWPSVVSGGGEGGPIIGKCKRDRQSGKPTAESLDEKVEHLKKLGFEVRYSDPKRAAERLMWSLADIAKLRNLGKSRNPNDGPRPNFVVESNVHGLQVQYMFVEAPGCAQGFGGCTSPAEHFLKIANYFIGLTNGTHEYWNGVRYKSPDSSPAYIKFPDKP